jgi:hypothetical protein
VSRPQSAKSDDTLKAVVGAGRMAVQCKLDVMRTPGFGSVPIAMAGHAVCGSALGDH